MLGSNPEGKNAALSKPIHSHGVECHFKDAQDDSLKCILINSAPGHSTGCCVRVSPFSTGRSHDDFPQIS